MNLRTQQEQQSSKPSTPANELIKLNHEILDLNNKRNELRKKSINIIDNIRITRGSIITLQRHGISVNTSGLAHEVTRYLILRTVNNKEIQVLYYSCDDIHLTVLYPHDLVESLVSVEESNGDNILKYLKEIK